MRYRLSICALSIAACQDLPDEVLPPELLPPAGIVVPGPTSGARLRPQYVESEDGRARRFLQLVDSETGDACRLPSNARPRDTVSCRPKATGMIVYLDAACTDAYVETHYADHPWVDAQAIVRPGAALRVQGQKRYFEYPEGVCNELMTPHDALMYDVGETIPDERLVSGQIVADNSDPRLSLWMFEGNDGSRVVHRIIDELSNAECLPEMTEAGMRCAPERPEVHDEGLLDPQCEKLAILDYTVPTVATIPERGGAIYRFNRSGKGGTVQLGRRAPDGSCTIEERNTGRMTLVVGVPYPASEWPELEARETEGDELGARVAVLPSGQRAEPEARLDETSVFEHEGRACAPMWIGETLRCAPPITESYLYWLDLYTDSQCTSRLVAISRDGQVPMEVPLREESFTRATAHLPRGEVHTVGEGADGSPIHQKNIAGACEIATYTFGASFFRAGPVVPADEFPALRLTVD